ncbi:MAG: DUF72 domain-containing protein, partial [Acidobacteriota bacterium]|nr:DUF72 domain-containing protein [Acidobacteriota bacterium]
TQARARGHAASPKEVAMGARGARFTVPIRVGTAGWSYEDWKGIVYPARAPSGFDPLAFLSSIFDTNEINSTFYRIPSVSATRSWAHRVSHNPRFAFTAKLFRGFTHERSAGSSEEKEFLTAMEPLAEAGRLSEVLVQFPVSFRNTAENRDALESLLDRFRTLPLAAEFRHDSWNRDDALDVLARRAALFVNIDQPWIGENLRATDHAAPGRSYYRYHGRNAAKWFGPDTSNEERYNYLYTPEQMARQAERLKASAQQAGELAPADGTRRGAAGTSGITAILNNHFRGQAVANAIQLQHLLTGELVAAPETLREVYPALAGITTAGAAPAGGPGSRQTKLFG